MRTTAETTMTTERMPFLFIDGRTARRWGWNRSARRV
jgi:hypothetical protein